MCTVHLKCAVARIIILVTKEGCLQRLWPSVYTSTVLVVNNTADHSHPLIFLFSSVIDYMLFSVTIKKYIYNNSVCLLNLMTIKL